MIFAHVLKVPGLILLGTMMIRTKLRALRRFSTSGSFSSKREMPTSPVALVTGSSRGIGKAIALELARSGCRVVVNYTRPESAGEAASVVEEINAMRVNTNENASIGSDTAATPSSISSNSDLQTATMAMAIQCDVRDPVSVKQMFSTISKEPSLGPVNILVNNAGITRDKLVPRMKSHDFTDVLDVNLTGTFHASQAAVVHMLKQNWGRIVNISSVVGQIGNAGQANYAASKAGVIGLTRAMAKEMASRGITINACCPGYIETDMTADIADNDADREALLSRIPLRRFGEAREVAGLVRFLVLDSAGAYMTGHCFNIDGGMGIGAS